MVPAALTPPKGSTNTVACRMSGEGFTWVTVTEVKPSPDMRHATVFVEPLGGVNAAGTIAALNRHRGFLRGELGRGIELKFTPELRFVEDTSFAEAERIARILHSEKVARDLAAPDDRGEDTQ